MRLRIIIFLLLTCSTTILHSAESLYTRSVDSRIKTIQIHLADQWGTIPLLRLNEDQQIELSFDLIDDEMPRLRYEIIHCNADGSQSALTPIEYLQGFNEDYVSNMDGSMTSFVTYTHYRMTLPSPRIKFLVSGNYAIRIFDPKERDKTLLYAMFWVQEPSVALSATLSTKTDVDVNKEHQQLSIRLKYPRYTINTPTQEIKLLVSQNNRNERIIETPLYIGNQEIVYEHKKELIFPAGNEYRRFEISNLKGIGIGVEWHQYKDPIPSIGLVTNKFRSGGVYSYDQTQQGRFIIRAQSAYDNNTDAEYAYVYFTLNAPYPISAPIYIDGEMTNNLYTTENKMVYNAEKRCYEGRLLLKQGTYNYRYVVKPDQGLPNPAPIEGNYYDTRNEYFIRAYHRPINGRYDRLVGTLIVLPEK